MEYSIENINNYELVSDILSGTEWLFVIKSQDQIIRRNKLIATKKNGKYGRISKREIGNGLLVKAKLDNNKVSISKSYNYEEPRHILKLSSGEYLLTAIDKIYRLNKDFEVIKVQENPLFAFLHTIKTNRKENKFLLVSSGYDSVFEIDSIGEVINHWLAWENGFNPDENGNWLALNENYYSKYIDEGKNALLIDPSKYGREGLLTSIRSAHPNLAIYDPYDDDESFIVSIGHQGHLFRINFNQHTTLLILAELNQMPHGLYPFDNGWCVTNTTKGEFWVLDNAFKKKKIYSFNELEHKVKGTEDIEWIQQIIPVNKNCFLALDANRGLIAVDSQKKQYSVYKPNENWCFQDALQF